MNNGKQGNERIISRLSVEAMTTDQLTPAQKAASTFVDGFWDSNGWGFSVSIITRRVEMATVPGCSGWSGGLGTSWRADPHEDVTVILFSQRMFDSPLTPRQLTDFRTLAYAAIND